MFAARRATCRWVFVLPLLIGCSAKYDGLNVRYYDKSTPTTLMVFLEFKRDTIKKAPREFSGTALLEDRVGNDATTAKEACRASFSQASKVTFNDDQREPNVLVEIPVQCPPMDPTKSRVAKIEVTVPGSKPVTLKAETVMKYVGDPNSKVTELTGTRPTPEISVANKVAHFKSALAAMPSPTAADKKCPDEPYRLLPRSERVQLETVSYDDALRAYGLPGARPALCPGLLFDPKTTITSTKKRLVKVFRAETCVMPVTDGKNKTFAGGSTSGVVAVVDLLDGTIPCHARIAAQSSDVVSSYSAAREGAQDVAGDFGKQLAIQARKAFHPIARYIESEPSPFDPARAPDYL